MRVDPGLATEFLERAAIEQKAAELRAQGYDVVREARFGDLVADLVAKRDGESVVFEFKVPGAARSTGWAEQVTRLRRYAQEQGSQFRLVIVRPPRQRRIEIEGMDIALADVLRRRRPSELDIGATTDIDEVVDVEITSLTVHGETSEVIGEAAVVATIRSGDGSVVDTETFPFSFEVTLDRTNRVEAVQRIQVDTSPWYGNDAIGEVSDTETTLVSGKDAQL